MTDLLPPCPASDASGFLPVRLGLRLDEVFLPLIALNAAPEQLDQVLPMGAQIHDGETLRLWLWPDTILASGPLPDGTVRATDVSHGFTRFRLRGVEALHFLDLYTRADLFAAQVRAASTIRTRLNHYDCTIWRANTRDIHLLVDRSLAQSFADELRALAIRHDPADPFRIQVGRPVDIAVIVQVEIDPGFLWHG